MFTAIIVFTLTYTCSKFSGKQCLAHIAFTMLLDTVILKILVVSFSFKNSHFCFYHGHVEGHKDDSVAAISTCDGIK